MPVTPSQYIAVFLTSALLGFWLTPLFRRLALKINWVDTPNLPRKSQRNPVPFLGGGAIVVPFVITTSSVFFFLDLQPTTQISIAGILLPAFLIAAVGLVDDVKSLSTRFRLVIQIVFGALTAIILILTGTGSQLTQIWLIDSILVVGWIVVLTNSLNLMDNMDGLAAGVSATSSLGVFALALANGQFFVAAMALVLAGAVVGFIPWNWRPAKIYLGDAGSLFIGFVLAALVIRVDLYELPRMTALLIPLGLLALPILDTLTVVVSRVRRGISVFEGGKDHLSHKLVRNGSSVKFAVARLVSLNAITAILLNLAAVASTNAGIAILGLLGLIYIVLFIYFDRLPATDGDVDVSG